MKEVKLKGCINVILPLSHCGQDKIAVMQNTPENSEVRGGRQLTINWLRWNFFNNDRNILNHEYGYTIVCVC